MNIENAKKISIQEVLESFSLSPVKHHTKTAFYFAVDREEKTPSLSVNYTNQTAFDFGTGKKYDTISLVQAIKKCSVSEALHYLSQFNFSFQKLNIISNSTKENGYEIIQVKPLEHKALLYYLNQKKLLSYKDSLEEIHYKISGKKYFGLAFKNDSEGYEVRNQYAKVCIGRKDCSSIKNGNSILSIFEGWADYFTFLMIEKILDEPATDYLILNSTSMCFKLKDKLQDYDIIKCYTDNDSAGTQVVEYIRSIHLNVVDNRFFYRNYKDFNEFLMRKSP